MRQLVTSSRNVVRSTTALALASVIATAISACGGGEEACTTLGCASNSPAAAGVGGTGGASGNPDDAIIDDDLVSNPSSGGALQDGQVCRAVRFDAVANPVNLLILLDRSVSMAERVDRDVPDSPTRWTVVTDALRAFINSDDAASARVGIQFFGLMNGYDDCSAAKYANPAVGIAPLADNRQALLNALAGTAPGSFTPTAPALEGALSYALGVAQLPENAAIPTVVVLASDVIPSECGPLDAQGQVIISLRQVIETLERFSEPPLDGTGNPVQPPIRTYVIGPEDLRSNATVLAQAGGGQTFLVGADSLVFDQSKFLDALLSIVFRPLSCEIDVPQTAPDTGEQIDFEKVRVRYTGASSGTAREFPRASGPGTCGTGDAWYYDNNTAPAKIVFCRQACNSLGAGELSVELGCAPTPALF